MKNLNTARIAIGIMIILGLLFFKPLAYFAGIMMIFSGITGTCWLEKLFEKFGVKASCGLK